MLSTRHRRYKTLGGQRHTFKSTVRLDLSSSSCLQPDPRALKGKNMTLPWSENAVPRPLPGQIPVLLKKKYVLGLALTEDEESTIERFAKPAHYPSLLDDMCEWDSVSLESLSPLLENMKEVMPAKYWNDDPRPMFSLCANRNVSLVLFELLLEYFPNAASFTSSQFCYADTRSELWIEQDASADAFLLHVACANEFCPDSILESLLKSNPSALLVKCVLGYGTHHLAPQDGAPPLHQYILSDGTPLHYMLRMRSALRLSTVQMLMNCDESVLRTMGVSTYSFGFDVTPLDCLVWNESIDVMIDVLRYVLRIVKDQGLTVVNGITGQSALHHICKNPKATRQAVGVILEEFPDLADLATRSSIDDEHAVHFLCRNKRLNDSESILILDLLVESDPSCSLRINVEGTLPLHLAAGSKSVGFIKHLVDLYPQAVRERNEMGDEPFHYACVYGCIDVCKFLLDLWPECLTKRDNDGEAVIHHVISYREEDKEAARVVSLMLERDASLASIPTSGLQGMLPLHLCCRDSSSDHTETLQVLFDIYPEALCRRTGQYNRLPIELVPDDCPGQRLFLEQQMRYYRLSQDTHALSTPDQLGELALHRAVRDEATLGAIKLLVKGYPSAPQAASANGDYPLHIACARLDGFEVATYLMAQHPPALSVRNGEGMLPLHILCTTRAEHEDASVGYTDCLFKMLRSTPDSLVGH